VKWRRKMSKLKYGIILLFSMILFSAPVLAEQTYYLPSKISCDHYSTSYTYDKYGHLKSDVLSFDESVNDKIESKWKYKYDENGKRVSGEMYQSENGGEEKLKYKMVFDKNQYLKSCLNVTDGKTQTFTWNKDGYILKRSNGSSFKYYSDARLKKIGYDLKMKDYYLNGTLAKVYMYNKKGLLYKTVSKVAPLITEYQYKYNRNGLVKTIIETTINTNTGKINIDEMFVSYSKTKTDKKTYLLMINGYDNCLNNALL
jgi:hypothetical protein